MQRCSFVKWVDKAERTDLDSVIGLAGLTSAYEGLSNAKAMHNALSFYFMLTCFLNVFLTWLIIRGKNLLLLCHWTVVQFKE